MFNSKKWWLDLADFYNVFKSPNVYYFDSIPQLFELLEKFNWVDDTIILTKYKNDIKEKWIGLLKKYNLL
jgi:hypothetical protein